MHASAGLLNFFLLFASIQMVIYKDQAGKIDWYKQFLGNYNFVSFQYKNHQLFSVIVTTDNKILASIDPTGQKILWKYSLEPDMSLETKQFSDGYVYTIHGNGRFIRKWDTKMGLMLWETVLMNNHSSSILIETKLNDGFINVIVDSKYAFMIDDVNGEMINKCTFSGGVHVLSFSDEGYNVLQVSHTTDDETNNCKINSKKSIDGNISSLIGDEDNYLYADKSSRMVLGFLKDVGEVSFTFDNTNYVLYALKDSKFVIYSKIDKIVKLYSTTSGEIVPLMTFQHVTAIDASNFPQLILMNSNNSFTGFNSMDLPESLNWVKMESMPSEIVMIHGFVLGGVVRSFMTILSDHSVYLFDQRGNILWERQESLANTVEAIVVNLPKSGNFLKKYDSFDVLTMFYRRISRHYSYLHDLFTQLLSGNYGYLRDLPSFSFNPSETDRILILYTKIGKIFGIDTINGRIIWQNVIADPSVSYDVHLSEKTDYSTSFCTIILKNKKNNESHIYYFSPRTGNYTVTAMNIVPKHIHQRSLHTVRPTVVVDHFDNIHLFPNNSEPLPDMYFYHYDKSSHKLRGYCSNSLKAVTTWTVNIPPNEEVVVVEKNDYDDVIHDRDIALPDERILRKYINPNLVVVVTQSGDDVLVYMLDGVSGLLLDKYLHEGYTGPISLVVSQNWIIFSAWNVRLRRQEISVVDLYYPMERDNTPVFSSIRHDDIPLILRQSYIVAKPITSIGFTRSKRDITARSLILSFIDGFVAEVPKFVIDSRRKLFQEFNSDSIYSDGLEYNPFIEINPFYYLSYYQQVDNVAGIRTYSTYYESTGVVVIYGQDLYVTLINPSGYFDKLNDGFSYVIIAISVYFMITVAFVVGKFAKSSKLKEEWK